VLQIIHEKIRGWFAWVIILPIAVTFVFWGIERYQSNGHNEDVVVTVNGTDITYGQIENQYKRLMSEYQSRLGDNFNFTQAQASELKSQVRKSVVQRTILVQAAEKQGFAVSTAQVEAMLQNEPSLRVEGKFSPERLGQLLSSRGYSYKEFITDIRNNMLTEQVHAGISASHFILPVAIESSLQLSLQNRDFSYLLVPAQSFQKQVAKPTADQIKAYYDQHQNQFKTTEKVKVAYLELRLEDLIAKIAVTPLQISNFYKTHPQNFKTTERWQVAQILVKVPAGATKEQQAQAQQRIDAIKADLNKGGDFANIAKEKSDDRISAANGGEMPWITPGSMEPAFETAIKKLHKAGEVSPVTRTQYGFTLIKLLANEPSKQKPLADVSAQIETSIKQNLAQQKFAELSEQLSKLTFENPTSLQTAADSLGLNVKTTDYFSRDGNAANPTDALTSNPKLIQAAFDPDQLVQNNNSDLIQITPNQLIVLRVADHQKAVVKPLKEVTADIQKQLWDTALQAKAKRFADDIKQQLVANKSVSSLLTKQDINWQLIKNGSRTSTSVPAEILKTAFEIPAEKAGSKSEISLVSLANGDSALVRTQAIHSPDMTKVSADEREKMKQQILSLYANQLYALYTKSWEDKAKLKQHEAPATAPVDASA
jgi:peptidyl-prolyl cis-trans isomerase D